MGRFRKKPVEIEARQFTGDNADQILDWVNEHNEDGNTAYLTKSGIGIPTLEGDHRAVVGDWVIQGVKGEFYPCKPDIFEATYDPA